MASNLELLLVFWIFLIVDLFQIIQNRQKKNRYKENSIYAILNTYRYIVNKEYNEDNKKYDDDSNDEVPFVSTPDDVFQCLQWRCKPQEWCLWSPAMAEVG